MPLSNINKLAVQASPGSLYIAAAPTTFVGATLTLKLDELFALFYTTGAERKALKAGANPWAVLDASGFKAKLKQEPVTFDGNDGPPVTISYQHLSAEAEVMIADLTADKLQEMLSNTANAQIATVASATQAGRETNAHGGEVYPTLYTFMYRYPSRQFAGEFDHVLIPFGTIEVDTDYELSKKSVRMAKCKIVANSSDLITNPDTGRPVYWIEDRATAPRR